MCSGSSPHLDDWFSAAFLQHLLAISRAAGAQMAKTTECVMSLFQKIISSSAGAAVHGILMNRFPPLRRHRVALTAPRSGVPLPDVCNVPVPRRTSDSDEKNFQGFIPTSQQTDGRSLSNESMDYVTTAFPAAAVHPRWENWAMFTPPIPPLPCWDQRWTPPVGVIPMDFSIPADIDHS